MDKVMGEKVFKVENEKFVVSDCFRDEEGIPLEWEIKSIHFSKNAEILMSCLEKDKHVVKINRFKYIDKVMAESIVHPDLGNAELQNSYGAKSKSGLLKEMLYAREYDRLRKKILKMENEKFKELT